MDFSDNNGNTYDNIDSIYQLLEDELSISLTDVNIVNDATDTVLNPNAYDSPIYKQFVLEKKPYGIYNLYEKEILYGWTGSYITYKPINTFTAGYNNNCITFKQKIIINKPIIDMLFDVLKDKSAYNKNRVKQLIKILPSEDVNTRDKEGSTVLMEISSTKHNLIAAAKLLLQKENIDINAQNNSGSTALDNAIANNPNIARLLLERNDINVNIGTNSGITPLMRASRFNRLDIVNILLKRDDIKINMVSCIRYTALYYAALNLSFEIVKLLLDQKDIEINTKDNNGETVLDYCKRRERAHRGYGTIIEMLENKMKN